MIKKEWIGEYSLPLRGFISRFVKDPQDTQDVLQETLISASESLPMYSGRSSFFTWLCGIARHEIGDFYRKKKIKTFLFSRIPWLEELTAQALGPEQELLKKEFEQKITKTMYGLSEGYREILRLKYYQGLTIVQIAKRLNETVKAVESRLFRARTAFTKAFSADSS